MAYVQSADVHANVENPNIGKRLEFPKVLYSEEGGRPILVKNREEQEQKIKEGWSLVPIKGHEQGPDGVWAPIPTKVQRKAN